MPLSAGSRLGPYEILAALGAGGMGELYRARDSRLGRDVAIKMLPHAVADDPDRLARLEREARTIARLNHPNIVVLYSVEEDAGVRFLTMELVEGRDLAQEIAPGGLPAARLCDLGIQIADALAAAHERNVIHRDLKPANVMVTPDGHVKVLDFGLAKSGHGPGSKDPELHVMDPTRTASSPLPISTKSAPGEVMGTVPYMAPEQVRGDALDARTDLFAFGVLLYELATGRRPFAGATSADLISSILRDSPTPVGVLRADLPPDLGRIIARCLEKDPARRMPSAKDVRTQLEMVRRAVESGGSPVAAGVAALRPSHDAASIAVLPFANLSRDEADEYFADGITEDVIAHLCKVRTLKVISRSSVMPFKRRDASVQDIAAQLQVASVLDGSVRRVGDRVRIVAQLIDPASGQSRWADTYDREFTDIFAIQTDVALQIAAALQAELSPAERRRLHREPTRDVQAYEHYLRGRHSLVRYTAEELTRAIEHFERAVARDPDFAMAHVGLAVAWTELAENGAVERQRAAAHAVPAAAAGLALDPELAEAHGAHAYARLMYEFDWTGAEDGFKRALELSPGSADTYDQYGRLCAALGRFEEALAMHERARELDPLTHRLDIATTLLRASRYADAERAAASAVAFDGRDARARATLGWALFKQGRTDEGLAELERAVALHPAEGQWLGQLGQAYALAGRMDQARAVLRGLENPARAVPASPYHLAYVFTGLGDHERALDCLERAFDNGAGALFGIRGSFLLAPLRSHPRFVALLKKMRLDRDGTDPAAHKH